MNIPTPPPTIAIVGGGPGGLTLARILHLRGIPATVFEFDEHPLARPQGGSLDIHGDSGQRALRAAGLHDAFVRLARYDDQCGYVYDPAGVLRGTMGGEEAPAEGDGDRPEIDRTELRTLLLESLPPGTIRWNSRVTHAASSAGGGFEVFSGERPLGRFDLVVGADGARSRIRPLLSDVHAEYSGVVAVELQLDDVDRRHPEVARMLPDGKLGAAGTNVGLIAQRSSRGHVRVYLMLRADEERLGDLVDRESPARTRARLETHLAGWDESLLRFVREATDAIAVRPLVALPVGHRWQSRAGVTLLGDAAHVMSPFGGEGVNLAMLDALDLADAISAGGDLDTAVALFEQRMCERAAPSAEGARRGLEGFVSDRGFEHSLAALTPPTEGIRG